MSEQENYVGVNAVFAADNSQKLKPMMTAREVMQILQISRPTLRRYAQKGILK
jgi:predicted DNA-binding transcriptional regulator AlpA